MIQFFSKPITTNLQDLTWSHSIMCFLCSFWLGVCNISWKYHLISIPPLFGCLLETNKYCKLYLLMLSWVSGFWWVVWVISVSLRKSLTSILMSIFCSTSVHGFWRDSHVEHFFCICVDDALFPFHSAILVAWLMTTPFIQLCYFTTAFTAGI